MSTEELKKAKERLEMATARADDAVIEKNAAAEAVRVAERAARNAADPRACSHTKWAPDGGLHESLECQGCGVSVSVAALAAAGFLRSPQYGLQQQSALGSWAGSQGAGE